MRKIASLVLFLLLWSGSALAGSNDPLFINLTGDDPHRVLMAIGFGQAQMMRGHPLTIFLNDKAVMAASKKNSAMYREQQAMLTEIATKGGTVFVCPMCSKKYGVAEADLVTGAKISNPDLTGPALFKDNTKTLSW